MLKRLALLLLLVVGVIGVLAMRQPDTFSVERRAVIAAPPERVFAQINDFHNWAAWSPWAKLDPNMALDINTPGAGVGATYAWKGNSDAGEGRMEIKESMPPSKVMLDLHFIAPIESRNVMTFQLEPKDAGTEVIWTMRGDNTLMGKVMGVFTTMDKMIGPDFEKGLSQLQTAAK